MAAVLVLVCGLTLLATAGQGLLPAIMQGHDYTAAMITVVSSVWAASLLGLGVLWLRRLLGFARGSGSTRAMDREKS